MDRGFELRYDMLRGKGEIEVYQVFAPAALSGKCRLLARLIIRKGRSIEVHRHHEERGVYYIPSGRGTPW